MALMAAICLMPALAILLHPKIFYGLTNRVLARIGKPAIVQRLRGWKLVKLLGYIILGLGWQSLAVFLIAQPVLHLKIDWWWMVAAAYCLAWIAGFLAFWAPGGFGVREYIFAIDHERCNEPRPPPGGVIGPGTVQRNRHLPGIPAASLGVGRRNPALGSEPVDGLSRRTESTRRAGADCLMIHYSMLDIRCSMLDFGYANIEHSTSNIQC